MKTVLTLSAAVALLLVAPGPCLALWGIVSVTKDSAKELGLEIRTTETGPHHVIVQLEFKTEGKFKEFGPEGKMKDYCRVDLRIGLGDNPPVTAALREDRTKPGRVIVSFTADRRELDRLTMWVMVPAPLGGTAYDIRVKDFVELK
jgi:hypothetical protein